MLKNILIVCFCVMGALSASGQSVFSGRILENKTRVTLHAVRIENLTTRLKTISLNDGSFSIAAKTGDLLVFNAFSYLPDTVLITDMHSREIFLVSKTTMLNQVNITDTSGTAKANPNAVQHIDPMFHGQAVVYQRDADFRPVGGIAIRLHYWSKDEKKRRKAAQSAKDRAISEHINTVFTPLNISNYVPLKGADLDNFILLYTPDVKEYTDKKFELASYLSACYQNWQTLTPDQKKAGQIFGN